MKITKHTHQWEPVDWITNYIALPFGIRVSWKGKSCADRNCDKHNLSMGKGV